MTTVPPLLLIHGAGLDRGTWSPVLDRIPGYTRSLAIDLPGHGGVPGVAYDREVVPRLAAYVAGLIAPLGLTRPHVVGHSLGGAVALELARLVPVAAVTALCPIGFRAAVHALVCAVKMRSLLRVARALRLATRERLLGKAMFRRLVLSGLSARPAALDAAAYVTSMLGSDLLALGRYAGRHVFRAAESDEAVQVNLVWAELDRIVPRADAARARRCLPAANHLVIPGAGHLVMRDDPDSTAAVIHAYHVRLARGRRNTN